MEMGARKEAYDVIAFSPDGSKKSLPANRIVSGTADNGTPVAGTPVPAIFVVIASMTYPEDRRCFGMHKESYCENDNAVQHNNQTASEQTLSPDEGHVLHKVRDPVRDGHPARQGAQQHSIPEDHQLYFCSASCESKFKAHPDRYLTEDASEHSHHHHHDHHEVSPDQIKQPHNRGGKREF